MSKASCSLCDSPAKTRGLCNKHYLRWWRHGDTDTNLRSTSDPTYATVHGRLRDSRGKAADYPCVDCGQPAQDWTYKNGGGGMPYSANPDDYEPRCRSCHGKLDKPRPSCSMDGCAAPHHSRGMCLKHYFRWYRNRVLQIAIPPREEKQ